MLSKRSQIEGTPWWSSGQEQSAHCQGPGFSPWPGELKSNKLCGMVQKNPSQIQSNKKIFLSEKGLHKAKPVVLIISKLRFLNKRGHMKGNRMGDNLQCLKVTKGLILKIYKELLQNKKKRILVEKRGERYEQGVYRRYTNISKAYERW